MNDKSLAEYLGEVQPVTPRELVMSVFEWMRDQLVMDFNESYHRVVKECADQIQKWLDQ